MSQKVQQSRRFCPDEERECYNCVSETQISDNLKHERSLAKDSGVCPGGGKEPFAATSERKASQVAKNEDG